SIIAMNLREDDEVIRAFETDGDQDIFIATKKGYGLWFEEADVSTVGLRALGVIAIQLKTDDLVISASIFPKETNPYLLLMTQRGACKRMNLAKFDKTSRARRGVMMLRDIKSKPHVVQQFYLLHEKVTFFLKTTK